MDKASFERHIGNINANGCVMLSLAIGHELGIFEFLCATAEPLSVQQIASSLKMKERYLYEWLSSMVAADIIHQDKGTRLYTVPESHKPCLTSSVAYSSIINIIPKRTEPLLKCCKQNGPWGIKFQENDDWFDWANKYRRKMSQSVAETEFIPVWENVLGLSQKLGSGIKVLELAAGTGNYSIALASKYPKSTFTGLDYSEHAVKLARELQKENKVENASFVHGDAHNLPETWTASFDLVFVSMLHDLSDPPKCIEEVLRIMKPNGCFSVFENGYHSDPVDNANDISASMCYVLSMYYCLTSSLADPPHVGYGSMWGIEEIEKTLKMFPLEIQRFDSKGQYWPISSFHCTRKQS